MRQTFVQSGITIYIYIYIRILKELEISAILDYMQQFVKTVIWMLHLMIYLVK